MYRKASLTAMDIETVKLDFKEILKENVTLVLFFKCLCFVHKTLPSTYLLTFSFLAQFESFLYVMVKAHGTQREEYREVQTSLSSPIKAKAKQRQAVKCSCLTILMSVFTGQSVALTLPAPSLLLFRPFFTIFCIK